jgi:fluoroquinolone transport system permease protein
MNSLRTFKFLGPVDFKNLQRDPLLRWIVVLPLIIALALRFVAPPILVNLEEIINLEVLPYYPAMMSYMLLVLVPSLVGMVTGFMLLDQRDDRTLIALQITPMSLNGYLIYRLFFPTIVSVIVTVLLFPAAGFVEIGAPALLLPAIVASLMAPLSTLFLGGFAANKVQGFALMKAFGIILIPPMIAYFIQSPWQLVLGIFPTYWAAKLYWSIQANLPGKLFYLFAGIAYQLVLVAFCLRRFKLVMTRE